MGMVIAKLKKPKLYYNVQSRAEKIISKEKPVPAPSYPSMKKEIEAMQKLNPTFMKDHSTKSKDLDDRLKNVFVTSTDSHVDEPIEKSHTSKSLPFSRSPPTDFEFGFYQPKEIPIGKCSLQQIFNLLTKHKEDPKKYNNDAIAREYNLDKKTIENLLEYYNVYTMQLHKDTEQEHLIKDAVRKLKKGVITFKSD